MSYSVERTIHILLCIRFTVLEWRGVPEAHHTARAQKTLREVIQPANNSCLRFSDHIEAKGCEAFRLACDMDVERIVAKQKHAPYLSDARRSTWTKIKNLRYTQAEGCTNLSTQSASISGMYPQSRQKSVFEL